MESVDVLVIGAGLAGLRTSQLLLGKGYSVVLLEANDVRFDEVLKSLIS